MSAFKLTDNLHHVGTLNPNMRVFDVVMQTEYGTTYNSFLLIGSEKTALIETCHAAYLDRFVENIESVLPLEKIDYIVLNHTEPDHSGALRELAKRTKNATILASQAGAMYLKNIVNDPSIKIQAVKDGEVVDLGGKTMQFLSAPFLHWPDSMFTWCEQEAALFTCDFFGAHYCEPYLLYDRVRYPALYEGAFKAYYDAIMAPFEPHVRAGLEKIRGLQIKWILTSHGPILNGRAAVNRAIEQYRGFSEEKPSRLTVPVFYASAYGNTQILAQALIRGLKRTAPDAEVNAYDMGEGDMNQMAAAINASTAFLIGSPTINADAVPPAWALLSHVNAINSRKKKALVFGSYGWSGEAIPNLTARLQGLKIDMPIEGIRARFVPPDDEIKRAEEAGEAFMKAVLAK